MVCIDVLRMNNLCCNITGYVLAEVRLYRKLRIDLDGRHNHVCNGYYRVNIGQISMVQDGFEQSARQHLMCINLLEQAQHNIMSATDFTNQ